MNETQIRERVRQAVGGASYPAGFSSRVAERLKQPTSDPYARVAPGRRPRPWLVGLGRAGALVGAILVVLLIASLVFGVHVWVMKNRPTTPAVPDPGIKQYQTMLQVDEQRYLNSIKGLSTWQPPTVSPPGHCTTIDDAGCPAKAAGAIAAAQKWLDDLKSSQPPARFAVLDAEMRRHLVLTISDLNALVSAYMLKDQNAMSTALIGVVFEHYPLGSEAADIIFSSQGTIATYTAAVRADNSSLLGCDLCLRLVSQNRVSCPANQTPSCLDEIAATRFQLEAFQGDLVRVYAPNSLAAKDAHLQADLLSATVALDAMASALTAGDQVEFQAGHDALRLALAKVDSDAMNITGGL